ncbi:hypothetical protein BGW36DRAFT_154833 [Talaromyces proteolyticus]|uniref:Zn(2)-C6 fungal-type domain-containing protein n=1 Tax=Talaromyces proteolyticus TaxID=1131652 RepID=A0AAD4KUJ2_9EURO|nr:uncharacterized protein BGW36DRAFT_154833 [Talaromyces proteolyticus]KAH8699070.1 hypothetical protein BGW36DRAFT_154833 [Talaromyces proteolyticus]
MPGPGGGPPRRSHTKSRNGCKTCKRRHIRCDETFPQCRNCTKHNCRCDYMDLQAAREEAPRSSDVPNLMMTSDIEAEIESWQLTGLPPFPELSQGARNDWFRFSKTDLRLIHHIAGLSIDFHRRGLSEATVWALKMPCLLAIAVSSDFVMNSVLAFSALHLAYLTGSKETKNLSYHYRGIAFKGLQNAIGTFSKKNCDAILAASLLLSWQATDWASLAYLQKGISSVLDSMHPYWKQRSEIAQFLESQRALRSVNTTLNPAYLAGTTQYQSENLERIDGCIADLQNVLENVQQIPEYSERINELLMFVKQLRSDMPVQSPENAFERLHPLRTWLFWLPTKMLRGGEGDLGALSILAQFYSTALALEPIFPEIEGSYLGCMAVTPIEHIDAILTSRKSSLPYLPIVQLAVSLMSFPRTVITDYKSCIQWSHHQMPRMGHFEATPPSPYHHFPDMSFPSTAPYTPPIHSPPTLAVLTPPFHPQHMYTSRPNLSAVYVGSPLPSEPGDECLSDYSRGTLEPSPAFSSPYSDEIHHQLPSTDTSGALNIGLLQESPIMSIGSVAPELWT